MPSLRFIWSASTTALRQSILSRQQPFFSRSFSQLSRLSLTSGLRGLRSRLQQSQDALNGTALAGAAAAGVRQFEQVRGMKTRSSVKRLCDGCKGWLLTSMLTARSEKEPGLYYLFEEPETQATTREIKSFSRENEINELDLSQYTTLDCSENATKR